MAADGQPELVAGVDEAGRGPLAGRVYAAAVILGDVPIAGHTLDSKQLSPQRRDALFDVIRTRARAFAIAWAEVEEIDRLNILNATHLAMSRAVAGLLIRPDRVRVDGNRAPRLPMQVDCVIGGDASEAVIGAASILAKVARDRYMLELAEQFPMYGFARHKGYPTRAHVAALAEFGICAVHRRSFAPVARLIG